MFPRISCAWPATLIATWSVQVSPPLVEMAATTVFGSPKQSVSALQAAMLSPIVEIPYACTTVLWSAGSTRTGPENVFGAVSGASAGSFDVTLWIRKVLPPSSDLATISISAVRSW